MVDPVTYSELVAGDVMKNLYEGFTEIDKDGTSSPPWRPDGKPVPTTRASVSSFRKGVKFHSERVHGQGRSGPSSRSSFPATGGLASPT
jgi:peptide/nickel transport system substrate-binding protein